MLKKTLALLSCLGTLLITGCISTAPTEATHQWDGRFSLIVKNARQQESHTGRFTLLLTADKRQILDLKTTIGNTLARIEQSEDSIHIQSVGLNEKHSGNAEQVMYDLLGFSVPIQGLCDWIDGQPYSQSFALTTPSNPPYELIQQHGWQIEYQRYDNLGHPRRIVFTRQESLSNPSIKITLLILDRQYGTP